MTCMTDFDHVPDTPTSLLSTHSKSHTDGTKKNPITDINPDFLSLDPHKNPIESNSQTHIPNISLDPQLTHPEDNINNNETIVDTAIPNYTASILHTETENNQNIPSTIKTQSTGNTNTKGNNYPKTLKNTPQPDTDKPPHSQKDPPMITPEIESQPKSPSTRPSRTIKETIIHPPPPISKNDLQGITTSQVNKKKLRIPPHETFHFLPDQ